MLIKQIIEKLQNYPRVTYTSTDATLEIPAQSPTGFRVWIRTVGGNTTVGFEGWHEEFSDEEMALKCFVFGLSSACRLRVFRCLGTDYKWQVLSFVDGEWVADSEVCLLFPTFLLPKSQRELQNDVIAAS